MPQSTSNAPPELETVAQTLARIAAGLQAARARTGLTDAQVADLLGQRGFALTPATLGRWESSGLLHVDSAVRLAEVYGTTLDLLAGRRAFAPRQPTADLPPPTRSSW